MYCTDQVLMQNKNSLHFLCNADYKLAVLFYRSFDFYRPTACVY